MKGDGEESKKIVKILKINRLGKSIKLGFTNAYVSKRMVLEAEYVNKEWDELIDGLVRSGILKTPNVIKAMRKVPRSLFLPEGSKSYAAIDAPLPIGKGQTVSAPLG